ncbi:GNAT family protein [Paenarthrobacter sp. NPDC089322]|uniref:GNAT family N-acetyltransferase n=1 Tax=Paenarthrobacter sp. NPDC089322 TaxID=3155065 RepID=UPI00342285E1
MNLSRPLNVRSRGESLQVFMRPIEFSDAEALAAAYSRNAQHLEPWEPRREKWFFTTPGQEMVIQGKLDQYAAGSEVPWVIFTGETVIGMITLTGIVRGPFLNANLGYWVDATHTGRGLANAAVEAVLGMAAGELELHRVQAATLPHNAASQVVLKRRIREHRACRFLPENRR